jgi:hypothetical protein
MGDEEADRKYYTIYEPHAKLIRWLFRRFKELGGNLPLLARELVQIDFRFPPFEKGITSRVSLRADSDGSFPLRNRLAIIGILTNRSYVGRYEYGGVLVSNTAHDAIVPLDDFIYAHWMFTGTDLDGEPQEHKPRERRYGGAAALLDGVLHSGEWAVYVAQGKYTARSEVNGFPHTELVIPVQILDEAFSTAMVAILTALELTKQKSVSASLNARIKALQQEQERQATDYGKAIARIDTEISNAEMAQRNSKELGDEPGYRENTKQLVQLRKDRLAIEAKAKQAGSEAEELEECHDLLDCACKQWGNMPVSKRKRLIRLLGTDANMSELSPHFLRLDVQLAAPVSTHMTLYLYRNNGSRQFWTEEEDSKLAGLFPKASRQAVMAELPLHSWTSICHRGWERLQIRRTANAKDTITHADMQVMKEHGARVDKLVWKIGRDVVEQAWGAHPGR